MESTTDHEAGIRPVILVTGATGAQGGSVARHLLARGRFAVRALTRQPRSEEAQALRSLGAELARGDLYDLDTLRDAMAGCYGVFGVTSFWEHFEREHEQGINLVDAVADSGIGHVVMSTLPPVKELSRGELAVPHFDLKASMEEYARSLGLPATFIHVAYYYENFLAWFAPRPQDDGSYAFGFPQGDAPLAAVSVEDVGGVVATIFDRREAFLGRTIRLVGDERTPGAYADAMSRAFGRRVVYRHVPREVFAAYRFPGAEDVANMFDFYRRFTPSGRPDLLRCRAIFPGMQTFESWLSTHRDRFQTLSDA